MSERRCALLFPPNWSTVVNGPHLALPLLAGAASELKWDAACYDLTAQFCRTYSSPPSEAELVSAVRSGNYGQLDSLYFHWEDSLRTVADTGSEGAHFGLLSGYALARFRKLSLASVVGEVKEGTVFSRFFHTAVIPTLADFQPNVVGITIASEQQVVPAVELLVLLRESLPQSYLLLGGNIVTRLRDSAAFDVLKSLVDGVVVFQGELACRHVFEVVGRVGVQVARKVLPRVMGDESVPLHRWPTPRFNGIDLNEYVGIPCLPYASTRGCYWGRCSFCAIPDGWSKGGYAGSAPVEFVVEQLTEMCDTTNIRQIKFVDEAMPPVKARRLGRALSCTGSIQWEAYARLEPAWEDPACLADATDGGLRKLYFGLEQAPTTDRRDLNKYDRGDVVRIIRNCQSFGVKVHLFTMVGYPGSSRADALATADFLIDNAEAIDTADLVGFRLERGKSLPGTRPNRAAQADWGMSVDFASTEPNVLTCEEISEIEQQCQEMLWSSVPRLLHPLYRTCSPWGSGGPSKATRHCLASSHDAYTIDR